MIYFEKKLTVLTLMLLPILSFAQEDTLVYKARLSEKDHFNSSGQRLNKAMAILRQDRANFHTFNIKDVEDESDEMFKNKEVRADMEKMVVSISKATEKAILNGTPVIQMEVFGDGGAEITLVTENQAINKTVVSEKKAVSENNNNDNEEVTKGISFKDLQLGMNKEAIPSKIKLIKGSKMSSFDDAFKFTDGNNNKIDIYGMSFDVSFTIKGDDTVKTIIYTAKEAKNISETTLVELAKLFTSKSLKKMTMNNYENGLLSSINLSNTEINNGVKDDFRVIYYNENSPETIKNQVVIQLLLEHVEEKKAEESAIMNKTINETLNDIYITIIDGGVLCSSVNSYKKLIDYAHKEPGSYSPSDCIQTKESQFAKLTAKESYRGINIIEIMGGENKFYWVSDMFVKRM